MSVSLLLTAVFGLILYFNMGVGGFAEMLTIARINIFAPILYLFFKFKNKELLYYNNLGLSKWQLLIFIYIYDIIFSITILSLCYEAFR